MTRPRRTLREFDDTAIAATDPTPPSTPVAATAAKQSPPRARTLKASSPKAPAVAGSVTRVGLYFQPATFEAAKSAYIIDLDTVPDAADSFARWIGNAIAAHTRLAPAARADLAAGHPTAEPGGGFTRSFFLPTHTIDAMNQAIIDDRQAHRVVSRSQFSSEAVHAAIAAARARNGGVLPPPPARLPNKPTPSSRAM